ncbi:MAG: hypothetical protein N3D73_02430 [Candidatus Diapherotrites archaeon]|nr:hypothetical protein [Candidatus Diapherotrites archaeon]
MYLDSKAFSVEFSLENSLELVNSLLNSRYWRKFSRGSIKLIYAPCWYFGYHAYELNKDGVASITHAGRLVFIEFLNEFDESIAKLYSKLDKGLKNQIDEQYPFEVKESKLSKNEVSDLIKIKLSSQFKAKKDNIVIDSLEKIYVPFWVIYVSLSEDTHSLIVNAITGEIVNEAEVPERDVGWIEITREMLDELKNPGAWVEYTKKFSAKLSNKKEVTNWSLLEDKGLLILLLALLTALFLIITAIAYL